MTRKRARRRKASDAPPRMCGNCVRPIDEKLMTECREQEKPYACPHCGSIRYGRRFMT